jgi:hypothetical protein
MKGLARIAIVGLGCSLLAARANGQDVPSHLRVVLDLSQSMSRGGPGGKGRDPNRLALLATSLLYDLARPSLGADGTFAVIPFDRDYVWNDTSKPPLVVGPSILAGSARREGDVLRQRLFGLAYDAKMTYFYPGLKKALDELDAINGGADRRRVIVIVTDGLPEPKTRKEELAHLRQSLFPALHGPRGKPVQVFVLAFGPEAEQPEARDFFNAILNTGGPNPIGELFVDGSADGRNLITKIVEIFARSFGYEARKVTDTDILHLGEHTPRRTAIVGTWPGHQLSPRFEVRPTTAGKPGFNNPDGLLIATHASIGRAYAMRWLLAPGDIGDGRIADALPGGDFVVLSPTELDLSIEAQAGAASRYVAMNHAPLPLRLRLKQAGVQGDPCGGSATCDLRVNVDLYIAHKGVPINTPYDDDRFTRVDPKPAGGEGRPDGGSRVFDLDAAVPETDRDDREWPVQAYIGIRVTRGGAPVATRRPELTPINLWPQLQLDPQPRPLRLLKRGQAGAMGTSESGWCTNDFHLVVIGKLPNGPQRVIARVSSILPAGLELQLDPGRTLRPTLLSSTTSAAGGSVATPSDWAAGVPVDVQQLTGTHRVCATTGRHIDTKTPGPAVVAFSLADAPYDRLPVFTGPLEVQFSLTEPSWWQRYSALLVLLLLPLLALLLYLWLRNGPGLPGDLQTSGPDGVPSRLGPESMLGWLWPRARSRRAYAPGSQESIGTVRPVDGELYRFHSLSAQLFEERADARTDVAARSDDRGTVGVSVQRDYRMRDGTRESRVFRMEFE